MQRDVVTVRHPEQGDALNWRGESFPQTSFRLVRPHGPWQPAGELPADPWLERGGLPVNETGTPERDVRGNDLLDRADRASHPAGERENAVAARVDDLQARLAAFVQRNSGWVALCLLGIVFVLGAGRAASKALWYDELMTYGAAVLPHWGDVWQFYAHGLDTPSPLSSLLVHATLGWPGSIELNARLPFLLAFLGMLYCMYRFMGRRYPAGYALALLLIPTRLDRWFYLATESRVYAFLLAGVAFSMVCWQAAGTSRRAGLAALGVWAGLALAMFSHAFAIFLFVPFAAAQLLRERQRGRVQWPLWAALLLFPLGYLPVAHGERMAAAFYRANFFARPHLSAINGTYRFYLTEKWFFFTGFVLFALVAMALQGRKLAPEQLSKSGYTRPEWLLLALVAALPIFAVPAAMILGAFREPYLVPLNLGFWLLAVACVAEGLRRSRVGGTLLLLVMLLCVASDGTGLAEGVTALLHPGAVHGQALARVQKEEVLQIANRSNLPVFVGDHVLYTKLFYYGDPATRPRLIYPVDLKTSAPYYISLTSQINFILCAKPLGFRIAGMDDIYRSAPHFLLLQGTDPNVWFATYLVHRIQTRNDLTMTLLGQDREISVYDVQFKPSALEAVSRTPSNGSGS